MTVILPFATRTSFLRSGAACVALAALGSGLSGCSTLGSSGPATRQVMRSEKTDVHNAQIHIIDVTDTLARRLALASKPARFSDVLGEVAPAQTIVGKGDVLAITIWETPPAMLFGTLESQASTSEAAAISTGLNTAMPPEMVDDQGRIALPYIGSLVVENKTPREVEAEIRARLQGVANKPQVMVGIAQNAHSNVTVVGEVKGSARVPLTPRGERLLDVIASAGGVSHPINKTTIQITRGATVVSLPMDAVVRDPSQNIRLTAGDVVTALYQPFSFTALGAIGTNAEVDFEANGITLAQALGRISGLQDNRADVKGVFLFRWEQPRNVDPAISTDALTAPDGTIPVIYRIDMSDPATFFIAQSFPIRDKDILYVSNAPGVDIQKFISVITQTTFSVIGITNAVTGQN